MCRNYCCIWNCCRTRNSFDSQGSCKQVSCSHHNHLYCCGSVFDDNYFVRILVLSVWWDFLWMWCSVRFLTGHSRKGGDDPLYVAEQAADPDSTLVIYMGLATLAGLASKLIANGLPPDTPAVAIERGTTPQQRLVSDQLFFWVCFWQDCHLWTTIQFSITKFWMTKMPCALCLKVN